MKMHEQSFSEQMQDNLEPIIHSKPPEGYIKRRTSTIPFGYELDPQVEGYLKPIPKQIHSLSVVSGMVHGDEISLAVAVDWLEASTNRKLSRMGLKTGYIGKIGSDDNGKHIMKFLEENNIDFLGTKGKLLRRSPR